jgi:hypothetical protein
VVVTGFVFVAVGVTGLAPPVVLVVATLVVGWPVVVVGGWLTVFVKAGAVVVGVVLVVVWRLGLGCVGLGFTLTAQVLVASDSTVLTPWFRLATRVELTLPSELR